LTELTKHQQTFWDLLSKPFEKECQNCKNWPGVFGTCGISDSLCLATEKGPTHWQWRKVYD